MDSWTTVALRHPRLTLAIVAVVTLVAVVPCLDLRTDNAVEAWLPGGDEELAHYESFRELFGEDNFVLVAVHGVALDTPAGEAAIRDLGGVLAGVGGVLGPQGDPARPWLDTSMLRSAEHGAAAWIVSPPAGMETAAFIESVDEALAGTPLGADAVVTGPLAINQALDHESRAAFGGLFPLVAALMLLVLWLMLRHVVLVLSILLVAMVATVWTLGLMAATGHTLNMVVAPLPALLLVLGAAYALHLIYAARASDAAEDVQRWSRGVAEVRQPSAVTALTTAAGLGALSLADLPPVAQLGIFGAVGVLASFALVFSLLPALCLTWHGGLGPALGAPEVATRSLDRVVRHRGLLLATAGVVAVVAGVGLSRLVVASDVLSYFPEDHPLVTATGTVEHDLTGLTPIEVWVSGDVDELLTVDAVETLREVVDACQALPAVTGVFGPLTSDLRVAALPAAVAAPMLRGLHASGELANAGGERVSVNGDRLDLRWTVASLTTSIEDSAVLADRVRTEVAARLPEGPVARVTGAVALLVRVQALLLATQVKTFGVSLLGVTFVLALAFRSLRLALLSLVPNLLPVLMTLGTMGFLGIPLNVATVTVAGIAFGLVVDDTVHILYRLAHGSAMGASARERLAEAMAATARPVTGTSVATAVGFAGFGLASFRPTVWFGLLIAATAVYALVCDLVVLPALIARRA